MDDIANTSQAEAWNGWEGDHWAAHPERYDGLVEGFDDALFSAAAIGAGDHVLDVGCGAGLVTRRAAGIAAQVLGIDLSAAMLERARADAARHAVGNVTFEQGDAQVHAFPAGAFDVAISRGGVMFFGDPVAAFANIARGLRAGGRLAFMGPQGSNPDGRYARATAALAPYLRGPSPAQRGMGSLTDPARIREILGAAGYTGVTVEPAEAPMLLGRDAADAAEFLLGTGPVRFNLDGLAPSVVAEVRDGLRAGFEPHETPGGVRLPGAVWIVTAFRPGG